MVPVVDLVGAVPVVDEVVAPVVDEVVHVAEEAVGVAQAVNVVSKNEITRSSVQQ